MSEVARRRLRRQALSLSAAVGPFGIAFGVVCSQAGLSVAQSVGFSSLVFTGGTQFAAVGVLNDGGSAVAAVSAGLLLAVRSLAFGVTMAPALRGSFLARAAMSQLMIDEAMAVGTSVDDPDDRRYGYLWGGLAVFGVWNVTTVHGAGTAVRTRNPRGGRRARGVRRRKAASGGDGRCLRRPSSCSCWRSASTC